MNDDRAIVRAEIARLRDAFDAGTATMGDLRELLDLADVLDPGDPDGTFTQIRAVYWGLSAWEGMARDFACDELARLIPSGAA